MLRGIRKASSNWLGRIVMGVVLGLIAISFAIWGIGDIFRGFGRSTVAKIGSTEITVEQFRQIYNDRLQQLGRQLGRPITPDQARLLRPRPAVARPAHRRNGARPARAAAAARTSPTPRSRARSSADPSFKGRPASSSARASRRSSATPATPSRASSPSSGSSRCAASSPRPSAATSIRRRRSSRPLTATRTSSARSTM